MRRNRTCLGLIVSLLAWGSLSAAPPPSPVPQASPQGEETSLPPGVQPDWWSQVQEQIQQEEYHLSVTNGSAEEPIRAPNRAQGFAALFDGKGVRLEPNFAQEGKQSWNWGLELVAWGRPEALRPAPKAAVSTKANRMEYLRGDLTEWFVNDERGLEQGFTIQVPPPTRPSHPPSLAPYPPLAPSRPSPLVHGPLYLDLALSGNLRPVFSEDGQAVDFYAADSNIAILRYASLKVTDATGRILPARFEGWCAGLPLSLIPHSSSASGGIRIVVDAAGAHYPLTVDPLTASSAWVATGEASGQGWGNAIATAGDVNGDGYSDVVVGAYGFSNSTGKAYLYLGGPSGLSTAPYWTALGPGSSSYFGYSVATAGDVNGDGFSDVIIGAYGYWGNSGAARLYLGGASGLSPTSSWYPAWGGSGDLFGVCVATAGDVNGDGYSDVVVGSSGYGGSTGKISVYLGGASGLSNVASWTPTGEAGGNAFGYSAATAGDVNGDGYSDIVVGAYGHNGSSGKAYLYLGGPSGLAATASWTATGEAGSNYFGFRVGTAGDVNGDGYADIVVGAYGYSGTTGKTYLYLGGPSGTSVTASWTASGEAANDAFGFSAATAGDINGDGYSDVVVGAYRRNTQTGKSYLYLGGQAGLSVTAAWTAVGQATSNFFGYGVTTAGDANGDGYSDVVVSAPAYSSSQGKGYLYLGSAGGLSGTPALAVSGESSGDAFGYSVASAGDVNGDGYADVVAGASGSSTHTGKAYLYLGSMTGLSTTPAWTATGEGANDYFGRSVAAAGDVNGDGYSDITVSAFGFNGAAGKAYLYLGGPAGLSATASWTVVGEGNGSEFGSSIAGAGDVNGDGYADLVVGAPGFSGFMGKSFLYLGGPSGLSAAPAWTAMGESANDAYGHAVATAGDVNRDGYSDVIVGADGYAGGAGKAYLYLGASTGLLATSSWTGVGEAASDRFGLSVASAGDVNGDGYSDALIGAPQRDSSTGKAYLYLGGAAGLSANSAWSVSGEGTANSFGGSAASAGDVNGDGYSDVMIGAPIHMGLQGKAYLFLGGASGLGGSPSWTVTGESGGDLYGACVAAGGDVTGDGYSDVVVGAYGVNGNSGRAYLYSGAGGPGISLVPRQLRGDASAFIAPGGRAADGLFQFALTGRSPFGRGSVKMEWQIAPLGGTFSQTLNPIQAAPSWSDSGLAGAPLQQLALLQARFWPWFLPQDEGPYVWRARTKYRLSMTPFQSHGTWFTLASNSLTETDLRRVTACMIPSGACSISSVSKSGAACTLTWQDPNSGARRTGWNIRRSSTVSPSLNSWPILGFNVSDGDAGAPDVQWSDTTGNPPPSSVWYYQVTTYNANCPAEGPF